MALRLGPVSATVRISAAIGVASGLLSACGGDDFMATNNAPTGVTQQSITVYSATTPGRHHNGDAGPADRGTRQDGAGRQSRRRPMPTRSIRPRSSCAAMRSTPTTAPSSIHRRREVTARSTARTSTSTASSRPAKEWSRAANTSARSTTAPARSASRWRCRSRTASASPRPAWCSGPSSGSRGVYGATRRRRASGASSTAARSCSPTPARASASTT